MLQRLSSWIIRKNNQMEHEVVLEEFMSGELFEIEATLTQIRQIVIILYSGYLAVSVKTPIYVDLFGYWAILGLFIILQITNYILERQNPKYRKHNYKVLRFQFYILLIALLVFIGGGSDSHLLLFSLYLLLAGLYIGPVWGLIVTTEIAVLVYEIFFYLAYWDFITYPSAYILLRVIAISIGGGISTYLWYRQSYSRGVLLKQELAFSQIATDLALALEPLDVQKKTVGLIQQLAKADTGLVISYENNDGNINQIYTVLFSWGYPDKPNFRFSPSERGDEGLTGHVLARKRSLLVQDIYRGNLRPKYPEIGPGQALRSYLGIPLTTGETVIGALLVTSSRPNQFNRKHQELLERLGRWLAIALKNTQIVEELKITRDYSNQLLESISEAMIVAKRTGEVIDINDTALNLLGYNRDEIKNISVDQLWSTPAEARHVLHLMRNGNGIIQDYKGTVKTKSGRLIPVLFSGAIIQEPKRNSHTTVGYFRKLVDLVELKAELQIREDIDSAIADAVQYSDLDRLMSTLIAGIAKLVNTDSIHIRLIDETGLFVDLFYGIGPYPERGITRKRLGDAVAGKVVETREEIVCQDTREDIYTIESLQKYIGTPLEMFLKEYLSYMVVPLWAGGEVIGSLNMESKEVNFFTPDRKKRVRQLADRVGPVIQNVRLQQLADDRMKKLHSLAKAAEHLLRPSTIANLYKEVVSQGQKLLGAEDCSLYMIDSEENKVKLSCSSTLPSHLWGIHPTPVSAAPGAGFPAHVAATGESLIFTGDEYKQHLAWQGTFFDHLDFLPSRKCHSLILVPIQGSHKLNRPPIGVLKAENKKDIGPLQSFSKSDKELLHTLANHFAGMFEQLNLRETSQRQVLQLSILQDASVLIQAEHSLKKQLFYALIAITIRGGLSFNRAALFLVDAYGGRICGECAISPEDEINAKQIYEDIFWEQPITRMLIQHLFEQYQSVYENGSMNQFVRTLQFSLNRNEKNVLVEMATNNLTTPKIITITNLPNDEFCELFKQHQFLTEEFALIPLVVGDKTIGGIYIDNHYNRRRIHSSDLSLLQLFASQLGAVIVNTQVMKERERLFFNVAHTIGAPITSIAGFAERLADGNFQDIVEQQEYIELIARNAEFLKNVAREAFYLTYLERVAEPLRLDWVSVGWLYSSLGNLNRFKLRENNIKIEDVSSGPPIELFIDRNLMLVALQALVDNAIKFSAKNQTVRFQVTISNDKHAKIEIQDEGIGISTDDLPRIWDPYFRSEYAEKKQFKGTGIGLQLTKMIVEAHDGRISIDSKINQGSTFSISLPLQMWRFYEITELGVNL